MRRVYFSVVSVLISTALLAQEKENQVNKYKPNLTWRILQ